MSDSAIAGTRKAIKEMADGTLRIQIDIDPRFKQQFHKLFPEIDMPVAIAPLVAVAEGISDIQNSPSGKYGQQAKELRLSSFFRRPEVWRAIGPPGSYNTWVHFQKCVICGKMDYPEGLGEGRCEAAHVRRAGESGIAFKADYAEVPMCHNDHVFVQHQHGESDAYLCAAQPEGSTTAETLELAKEWFNKQRIIHVQQWAWESLKQQLGYDSWSDVPPWDLLKWAEFKNVAGDSQKWLPQCYYDDFPVKAKVLT